MFKLAFQVFILASFLTLVNQTWKSFVYKQYTTSPMWLPYHDTFFWFVQKHQRLSLLFLIIIADNLNINASKLNEDNDEIEKYYKADLLEIWVICFVHTWVYDEVYAEGYHVEKDEVYHKISEINC